MTSRGKVVVRTWLTIRVYRRSANHTHTVHIGPADSVSFFVKHHRRMMTSKAYGRVWLEFYSLFQKFSNTSGSNAPHVNTIQSSERMQTFVLEAHL
ncbi:hypothetical protein MRX96_045922 [Rhipicephalus microplus]